MRDRTGLDYLKIDISNNYGHDKETWEDRIQWVNVHIGNLEKLSTLADKPILYTKAVNALRDAQKGIPTGFIMGLDSTASGIQIMSVLSGCYKSAMHTNLIDPIKRRDVYTHVADEMNKLPGVSVNRAEVKPVLMTVFYGSKAAPKKLFGKGTPELAAFYKVLSEEFPGPLRVMKAIEWCWNTEALVHQWVLPDGHVAYCKVHNPVDKKIEVDELDHATFTHRAILNTSREYGVELIANVVHSIDGYIMRQMVHMSHQQGFEMVGIHDSFWCSPNNMQKVRENYLYILMEIADSNLLEDIVQQLKTDRRKLRFVKNSYDLSTKMKDAEYALS